jgi:hypothetical protein
MQEVRLDSFQELAAQVSAAAAEEVTAMTNRSAEIEFLERLYGAEVNTMHQDFELNRLAERAICDLEKIAKRAGTDGGAWCYGCGMSGVSLDHCACGFSETFACSGRLFCADCRKARQAVANHVDKILAAKRVDRVSSIRLRLLRELRSAARAIEGEESDPADSRLLSYWLANADEFGDSSEAFRAGILRAFRQANFLDFAALAKALEHQRDESIIRSIIRANLVR